jgi:hypothetical protein
MGKLRDAIRKASPAPQDMRVAAPLANFTVAALQEDDAFILGTAAPILPVDKRSDLFFTYDTGDFNRDEMKERGSSEESAGSGWTMSNDNYKTVNYSVHKDDDEDDLEDVDQNAIDPTQDAADWGANKIRIKGDRLVAPFFAQSIWNTDIVGVDSAASAGTSVLRLDVSGADPQKDLDVLSEIVRGKCGKRPNLIIPGRLVHSLIVTNAAVRSAIQYTEPTTLRVVNGKLAEYFGVDEYIVPAGFYNTAAEKQTTSFSDIIPATGLLMLYSNPEVGRKKFTALRTFAWKKGGQAPAGVFAKRFYMEHKKTWRNEFSCYFGVKQISADAGCYIREYNT